MKTDLIVIWTTGEIERHEYPTEEAAQKAGEGFKKAFGNQIQWTGTTPHREPQKAPQPDRIEAN